MLHLQNIEEKREDVLLSEHNEQKYQLKEEIRTLIANDDDP